MCHQLKLIEQELPGTGDYRFYNELDEFGEVDEAGPACSHCHHAGMVLIGNTLPGRLLEFSRKS